MLLMLHNHSPPQIKTVQQQCCKFTFFQKHSSFHIACLQNSFAYTTEPFARVQNDFAYTTDAFARVQNSFACTTEPIARMQNDFACTTEPIARVQNDFVCRQYFIKH